METKVNLQEIIDNRISKLNENPARRIDFMFTPKKEFAFAILYFTGSKEFNTVMRQRALDLGYSMNEHGFTKMVDGKKAGKLNKYFKNKTSLFAENRLCLY